MIIHYKTIFRFLSIITMASIFLPIVFENIPFPFSSTHFYALLWIVLCSLFYQNVLLNKEMLLVYLLCVVLFLGVISIWRNIMMGSGNKINFLWLLHETIPILLPILIYKYFMITKDYRGLSYVIWITLFFIIVTSLTSIVGLYKYPMAARDASSYRVYLASPGLRDYYKSIGIGNYNFFTPLSLIFPVMIYSLKKYWNMKKNEITVLLCLIIVVFFFAIIKAKFTMALLSALVLIVFSIFIPQSKNYIYLWILGIMGLLLSFIIPIDFFSGMLINLAGIFKGTILEDRIIDLIFTFKDPVIDYHAKVTHAGARLGRVTMLWKNFSQNPFWGSGFSTGHSFWFDRLAMLGVVGTIPWLLVFINQIRYNLKNLKQDFKYYYAVTIFVFITMGIANHVVSFQMFAVIFFLVPSFNYLVYPRKFQKS